MTNALEELRAACRGTAARAEAKTIDQGIWTWFHGRPGAAPDGTVALAMSDDASVIIRVDDVRAVEKGEGTFRVAVSADAHVLLRVDKVLKATPAPEPECGCHEEPQALQRTNGTGKKPKPTIEIGEITVCDIVCGDIYVGGIKFRVCVPVNCKVVN